jgi:hypothetical protein
VVVVDLKQEHLVMELVEVEVQVVLENHQV